MISIPVLMYHFINPSSTDYLTVSTELFERQIAYLADRHRILTIREAFETIENTPDDLQNSIVITFDDGMSDNYRYAAPILEKYNLFATFFIIAGFIGSDNRWNHRAYHISQHMGKKELRDLHRRGFDIQSHTLTHQRLTKLPDDELENEFLEAKNILERLTGINPVAISYPYGAADERCLRLCRRYYRLGFTSGGQGTYFWNEDRCQICRIYVAAQDEPENLEQKISNYRKGNPDV